ncbi:MAG: penicillin acylase family protein, partial [Acidobacteriales bacterium]|nr:penicillin acylase family protein [Terriglobales bacterium]
MATTTLARTSISRWRKWRWLLLPVAALVAVAAIAGGLYFLARASLPQLDGAVNLAGLARPVTVSRDGYGVPHIRAENLKDLLFAQGYVTAQDRFWQMDMTRRFAAGELSEVLGRAYIKTDRAQRILSLRQVAERSAARLSATERVYLEAYVRGVNAYLNDYRDRLPLEFRVLRYSPRPWTVEDSFLVGASMAQTLSHDQFESELVREKIVRRIGPELAADIYPNTSWRDRPPGISARKALTLRGVDFLYPERFRVSESDEGSLPSGASAAVGVPRFARNLFFLGLLTDTQVRGQSANEENLPPGSNNWVVSGAHTVTGRPLLSNDMHLGHRIPNTWYEAHLTAGDFDVAGVTLPGTPFVIVGHNRRIAWGFTNLGPDVEDIYIETFNDKGEYLTPKGWQTPERRLEVIRVKGGKDVEFEVLTTRHGPIASELMPGETRQIALKWTAYDPEALTFVFAQVNGARNWDEFRRAFSRFRLPGQNVVYADADGHIGYQATGAVPIRASGDGSMPVPGHDDAYEWNGYIPFDELPRVFDPPSGVIATANSTATPQGYPRLISNEWGSPYRTERIYQLLASKSKLTAADMLNFQNDIYSEIDLWFAKKFAAAVKANQSASSRAREAAALLRGWDGRFSKESAAATLVSVVRAHVLRLLLEAKLGPSLRRQYRWYRSAVAVENLLSNQPKQWLPSNYSSYQELIAQAVEFAVSDPSSPADLKNWTRGTAFPLRLQHPVFGMVPVLSRWTGPGTVAQSGSGQTVKQVGRSFGPSQRLTVD